MDDGILSNNAKFPGVGVYYFKLDTPRSTASQDRVAYTNRAVGWIHIYQTLISNHRVHINLTFGEVGFEENFE
jgi:hypothetical protein